MSNLIEFDSCQSKLLKVMQIKVNLVNLVRVNYFPIQNSLNINEIYICVLQNDIKC